MKRVILGGAALLTLSACVAAQGDVGSPDPLPPLAAQKDAPRLAMLEHVLDQYFASDIPNPPTVCASWHDGREEEALPPEEEVALISRFPSLAPMTRCTRTANGWRDAETEDAALVFTLHNFTCSSDQSCSAWGGYQSSGDNSMSYLYRGEWDGAEWQFTRDPRIIAE
ncbi:hypothetical protein [Aurantiacibacter rhizosphaerae]|uniref:Lipoprotein n=1 Tax=Aurantiacibacter rhizosphaerae TaxID=2691582 RepID=A0A844XEQ3_9SPHN|nr:hypothetical protein [Aurantiacibacter rhizosphaerae]MWV28229.1 hypothetical protein [Aurantiacibacter rhizosphaerae]